MFAIRFFLCCVVSMVSFFSIHMLMLERRVNKKKKRSRSH